MKFIEALAEAYSNPDEFANIYMRRKVLYNEDLFNEYGYIIQLSRKNFITLEALNLIDKETISFEAFIEKYYSDKTKLDFANYFNEDADWTIVPYNTIVVDSNLPNHKVSFGGIYDGICTMEINKLYFTYDLENGFKFFVRYLGDEPRYLKTGKIDTLHILENTEKQQWSAVMSNIGSGEAIIIIYSKPDTKHLHPKYADTVDLIVYQEVESEWFDNPSRYDLFVFEEVDEYACAPAYDFNYISYFTNVNVAGDYVAKISHTCPELSDYTYGSIGE